MNKLKIIFIFLLTFFLTGCWDRVELDEQSYVVAIGVDEGKDNLFSITYQIANTQATESVKNIVANKSNSDIITVSAPDFLTARDLVTSTIAKKITFSHTRVIIVGESLARSKNFLEIINSCERDRQVRRNMYIAVSREKASKFIRSNNPVMELSPHKFYDYSSKNWKESGLVPISTINDFLQSTENKDNVFLTIYGSAKQVEFNDYGNESNYLPGQINEESTNPTQIIGAAVIKEGKMISALSGAETRLVMLLNIQSKAKNMYITFPDPLNPKNRISAQLTKNDSPKIKINIKGDEPDIDVTVPLILKISAIKSFEDYVENSDKQAVLKKSFEEYMKQQCEILINKTKNEFKGEPFMWSLAARRKCWTIDEYKQYKWIEKYPYAKVKVHFHTDIKDFGKKLRPQTSSTEEQ